MSVILFGSPSVIALREISYHCLAIPTPFHRHRARRTPEVSLSFYDVQFVHFRRGFRDHLVPEYSLLSGFIQHILKIKWNVYAGRANNEEGCMTVLHERLTRDMQSVIWFVELYLSFSQACLSKYYVWQKRRHFDISVNKRKPTAITSIIFVKIKVGHENLNIALSKNS